MTVSSGDVIDGLMSYNSNTGQWQIRTADASKSTYTELDITGDASSYTWAATTLEGYNIADCSALSEGTHFYNLALSTATGSVTPSWVVSNNYQGTCGLNVRIESAESTILNTSDPHWDSVSWTPSITLGQSASITLKVTNLGGIDSRQTGHLSFPNAVSSAPVVTSTDFGSYKVFAPGSAVNGCYSGCVVTTQYYFVEGSSSFATGDSHSITVSVVPASTGTFYVYFKTIASATYKAGAWDPNSGSSVALQDQESEYVLSISISVSSAPTQTWRESGTVGLRETFAATGTCTANTKSITKIGNNLTRSPSG